jgi:hypothetical protein
LKSTDDSNLYTKTIKLGIFKYRNKVKLCYEHKMDMNTCDFVRIYL